MHYVYTVNVMQVGLLFLKLCLPWKYLCVDRNRPIRAQFGVGFLNINIVIM